MQLYQETPQCIVTVNYKPWTALQAVPEMCAPCKFAGMFSHKASTILMSQLCTPLMHEHTNPGLS